MSEVLTIKQITKFYGKTKAIDNVSLSIKPGEVIGIVGPNGAGKSTLMKMIVGLIKNYQGEILIDGKSTRISANRKSKLVGCVIENPGFYPELSGLENLQYFAKLSGPYSKSEVENIVAQLELGAFIQKKTKHYSLGMKQRLGIAQALLGNPNLLVLDEPTNGLDPFATLQVREVVRRTSKECNKAVIISSHVLSEIEAMCDRVIFMKDGKFIEKSDTHWANRYTFVTDQPEAMMEFLQLKGLQSKRLKDQVTVEIGDMSIQDLVVALSTKKICFNEFFKSNGNLEREFFEIIGANHVE